MDMADVRYMVGHGPAPAEEHTHIHLGMTAPRRARSSDAAPLGPQAVKEVTTDPRSGQGGAPESGFVCDFRYGRGSRRWIGQDRAGRRYRLTVSNDGQTYRVQGDPDDEPPLGMQDRRAPARKRLGDHALAHPGEADLHDAEVHISALASYQELMNRHFSRP
jgi:hypothetical protein